MLKMMMRKMALKQKKMTIVEKKPNFLKSGMRKSGAMAVTITKVYMSRCLPHSSGVSFHVQASRSA